MASLALACLLVLTAVPSWAATLTYNFNNGLQGWTQIGTTVKTPWNSGGNAWGATQSGSIYGYDGDDGADATYWVRSPAFQLDGSGPLTVRLWGGKANASAPANQSAVPANAISGAGFKGVVLRDAATGDFVKSLAQSDNNANANYSLSVADLASYANNGRTYTLDFLDYDYGGWGWVGLDNVSIPGYPMQVDMGVATAVIFKGSNTTVTITIPVNLNATTAVTVFVTNSNPSTLSVNGSSASVVPIVFPAGTAISQNVTAAGTGLGHVVLQAGSPGLVAATTRVTVIPCSGLIGRWVSGSEDLLDKSGYTPAGTHDGVMSAGATATFSTDVPPGTTGSSLDLAASGGAVLITNSVVTDPGYRPTFDDGTISQLSVVCWARGLPGTWNPFVSKWGEDSTGWQLRKRGGDPVATFTIRSTTGEDDPFNGSTLIDDGAWHHFAATWDGTTGVRKLYVDGKLNVTVPNDLGPMGLASVNYLTLGGRCGAGSANPGNLLSGQLYDVQIYAMPLSGSTVQSLFLGNTTAVIAYADSPVIDLGKTGQVSVSIPAAANATAAVTVFVTNLTPAVVSLAGAVGNVATLTFPAGGVTSRTLSLTGLVEGQARLACAAAGLTEAAVTVSVYGPHLVGQWFSGAENFANVSPFTAPGVHDGLEVGTPGNLTFVSDTPPSKSGKAAQFGGGVGLQIANTSLFDPGYIPTFDDVIGRQFSVAFWAKGLPGSGNPYVSKRGEDAMAWQIRQADNQGMFTLRGTATHNDDPRGSADLVPSRWQHFAAVWDGYSGTRRLYIDGNLETNLNLTGDFGPFMPAPNHHLILGAREQYQVSPTPGVEAYYSGLLYDVRIYNYPLSETEVKVLSFVAALKVVPTQRSVGAPRTMPVDVIIPVGANQSQSVVVQVLNETPAIASLAGATGNSVTLTYPVGGSLTQQVVVAGIKDGTAKLSASGGGFVAGSGTFNVWADPGARLIGHWFPGEATFAETSGFRPAGTHDAVPVGANAPLATFSAEVPPGYSGVSLDLSAGSVAVVVTNSATSDLGYVETFDEQISNKFSITFWAKGTPNGGDWNPWVSKRGEDGLGYQVRRYSSDNPIRPTFTLRGTSADDDPSGSITVDNDSWHHYAATWDGTTGLRKLYVDGVRAISLSGDYGPMGLASANHFMLGARDNGGFGNYFSGLLFDVRFYSYALSLNEISVMVNPPTALSLTLPHLTIPVGASVPVVVMVPATATSPVTVNLTNNSPAVASFVGSTGNVFSITFPVGTQIQTIYLQAIGVGQILLSAGAAGLGSAELTTVNMVVASKLIGHWLSGQATLADTSSYTPAGTHDGVAVGLNPAALAFSTDVPAGFSGQSLDLTANATSGTTVGVVITNSATTDGVYLSTFDAGIASTFSVAVWAKGLPSTWNGFVSKRGEDGIGWQVRRYGGDNWETFTIRGAAGNEDPQGSIAINDGQWHHFAGVWDGLTGTRKCYVDGVLDPKINLVQDFGPMSLAPNHHIGLGVREASATGNYEGWFSGKLFDVRIYNYPITAADVRSLYGRVTLTARAGTNQTVVLTWPTTSGFVLQSSPAVDSGWVDFGGSVVDQSGVTTAIDSATGKAKFYRLIRR